jgi:hypothetical protein
MAVIEAIATTYLEADAASVTFSSIPATYEHLQIRASVKMSRTASTADSLRLTFISAAGTDTGNNYSYHWMMGDSTTPSASGLASTRLDLQQFIAQGSSVPAAEYATTIVDILDYRNGSKNTTVSYLCGFGGSASPRITFGSGVWDDVAAVTGIILDQEVGPNFMRGSEFTLYGLNSA